MLICAVAILAAGCGTSSDTDPRALAEQLSDPDATTRLRAALRLKRLGEAAEPALPELIRVLEHPERSWDVSDQAVYAISNIGPNARAAVPVLVNYLETSITSFGRTAAARALGRIRYGPDVCVPALVRALDDESVERPVACRALSVFGDKAASAVPAVIRLLATVPSVDSEDLQNLISLLEAIGPEAKEAVPRLVRFLLDETADLEVRIDSANALGAIGRDDPAVLPALEAALGTKTARASARFAERLRMAIARPRPSSR